MADPKEVDIKVFLDLGKDPPFHLQCDELPKGTKNGDFVFTNDHFPGFILNYVLQEPTTGYRFPDDLDEALYSAKTTTCPTSKGQWGQFKAKSVSSDNKTLVVRNMNQHGHEGQFSYTLRVTKTPHNADAEYLDLDPGGTNTNGSAQGITLLNLAIGVGIIAATGIVLYSLGVFDN